MAFFTDAVFAIAMTLLIVSIGAPELRGAVNEPDVLWEVLRDKAPEFVSFFLAFLLLGRYWMAQHEFFAALGGIDRSLMTATLVYLAFVAFLPFPTELVGRYEHNPGSVVLFALCLAMISGMESIAVPGRPPSRLVQVKLAHEAYRVGMIQSTTPVALVPALDPDRLLEPHRGLTQLAALDPSGHRRRSMGPRRQPHDHGAP